MSTNSTSNAIEEENLTLFVGEALSRALIETQKEMDNIREQALDQTRNSLDGQVK